MTSRRYASTLAAPRLEGRDSDAPTPCDGHFYLFDELIDRPANRWNQAAAADLCGACPIRDNCLLVKNRDEDWAKAVTVELSRRAKRERKKVAA